MFCRVAIAACGLALWAVVARPPGPALLSVRPGRCVLTGVVLAVHWTAMFAAYDRAPDSTVIFLIFLAPLAIAVIERPGRRLVLALAIAVAGFALIAGPTVTAPTPEAKLGLAFAALSGALFVVLLLLAKPLAEAYGGLRLTLLEMVVAGVVLAPVAATADWSGVRRALPWLLVLGLVHTAIGTVVYLHALSRLRATEVGILGYLEPVGVVLFAWALLGDVPDGATIVGGALVVAGGTLAVLVHSPSEVSVRVPR